MSYERRDLMTAIRGLPRYIVCGQVTKRPIFDFVSPEISPNAALTVFAHDDDYTFGILQSTLHWIWFNARCSTLKSDPRYTSNTVFDSFPWPQSPSEKDIAEVALQSKSFRTTRDGLRKKHNISFRDLYRELEKPGENPLKVAQKQLDDAVSRAYSLRKKEDPLEFLLGLNAEVVELEKCGEFVQKPGLPDIVIERSKFVSGDKIEL